MTTHLVIRHAKAGDRSTWRGDDRRRPLTPSGVKQAQQLVALYQPFEIGRVVSSPYVRCVQTVEPVAAARGLQIESAASLAEGHGLEGLLEAINESKGVPSVLCTHGDLLSYLLEDLVDRSLIRLEEARGEKACTWVLELTAGTIARARHIPAP